MQSGTTNHSLCIRPAGCRLTEAEARSVYLLPSSRPLKALSVVFWKAVELLYRLGVNIIITSFIGYDF